MFVMCFVILDKCVQVLYAFILMLLTLVINNFPEK